MRRLIRGKKRADNAYQALKMRLDSTELAYYLLITANWRGKPEISTGHCITKLAYKAQESTEYSRKAMRADR